MCDKDREINVKIELLCVLMQFLRIQKPGSEKRGCWEGGLAALNYATLHNILSLAFVRKE